jgi:glycosidase
VHDFYPRGARFLRKDASVNFESPVLLLGERGTFLATVINFMIDGVPFILNGEEISAVIPQDIEAHWPIRWEAETLARAAKTRQWYKALFQLRREDRVLNEGETSWLQTDSPDRTIAFLRRGGGGEALVVANLSNRASTVSVHLTSGLTPSYHVIFGSASNIWYNDDSVSLSLDSLGYYVAQR